MYSLTIYKKVSIVMQNNKGKLVLPIYIESI